MTRALTSAEDAALAVDVGIEFTEDPRKGGEGRRAASDLEDKLHFETRGRGNRVRLIGHLAKMEERLSEGSKQSGASNPLIAAFKATLSEFALFVEYQEILEEEMARLKTDMQAMLGDMVKWQETIKGMAKLTVQPRTLTREELEAIAKKHGIELVIEGLEKEFE